MPFASLCEQQNVIDHNIDYCILEKKDVPTEKMKQLNNPILKFMLFDLSEDICLFL